MEPNEVINGRYRLIEPIGSGSFGQVWLAYDLELGIKLAVKIYIALDSKGLDEFKTEFKNSRNLNHPHLLRADHYDVAGNHPYLVMNYCPDSLGNRLGHLDEQGMWKFIAEVASGLSYLHEMDIVHRDVKPDNVLVNEHGDYVVSDFGLSKKMRSTLRRASSRNVGDNNDSSGTLGYMAPEMFSARPEAVKASDIWAFGATIYEVATGDLPFLGQGGVMELGGAEIPNLPEAYSPALNSLMRRCLARDAQNRPTAEEILQAAVPHVKVAAHAADEGKKSVMPPMPPIPPTPGKDVNGTIYDNPGMPPMPPVNGGNGGVDDRIEVMPENVENGEGVPPVADVAVQPVTVVKKGGLYKVLFYVVLGLMVVVIAVMSLIMSALSSDVDYYTERSRAFSNTLNSIQYIVNNGTGQSPTTYSPWTSTNHNDGSTSSNTYRASVSADDVFSLDYDCDSESYDHFKVYVSLNGSSETLIKDVSGPGRSGHVSYKAPSSGDLTVRCVYTKDGSVSSGRDNVRVTNVKYEPSTTGAVKRELETCPYYF